MQWLKQDLPVSSVDSSGLQAYEELLELHTWTLVAPLVIGCLLDLGALALG